jgi:hypothetical protein
MGANLMDVSRRPLVVETSLRTSAEALSEPGNYSDDDSAVEQSQRLSVS